MVLQEEWRAVAGNGGEGGGLLRADWAGRGSRDGTEERERDLRG